VPAPESKDVWIYVGAAVAGIAAIIAAVYVPLVVPDKFRWNSAPMLIIYGLGILLGVALIGLARGWRFPLVPKAADPITWEIKNTNDIFAFLIRNTSTRTAYNVVVNDSDLGTIEPNSEGRFTVESHPGYGGRATVTWTEKDKPSSRRFTWTGGLPYSSKQ